MQLTKAEREYVDLRKFMTACVSSVHGVITSGEAARGEELETQLGEARAEQLKDVAFNEFCRS